MGFELSRDEICSQQLPSFGLQSIHIFNWLYGIGSLCPFQRHFYCCAKERKKAAFQTESFQYGRMAFTDDLWRQHAQLGASGHHRLHHACVGAYGQRTFVSRKITVTALVGIALAMSAALLLAWGSAGQWGNHPLGVAVMLLAAITWGTGNAMMKNSRLSISGITLTFWALFIAFVFFVVITTIFERDLWAWPTLMQWLAILYGGVITFAVSYVAWFHVARKLSAVSSGLSITLVPVFGVTGGALILGEAVTLPDIIALVLILLSMLVVLFPDTKLKDLIFNKLRKS